jgi:ABC-type antimicrobial peptide transport system permease subunit
MSIAPCWRKLFRDFNAIHGWALMMIAAVGLGIFAVTVFAVLVLVLGVLLSASMLDDLLAQQARQIAVMKAIGARTRQIVRRWNAFRCRSAPPDIPALPIRRQD